METGKITFGHIAESQPWLKKTDKPFPLGMRVGLILTHLQFGVSEAAPMWPALGPFLRNFPLLPTTKMNSPPSPTPWHPVIQAWSPWVTHVLLQETEMLLERDVVNLCSHDAHKSTANIAQ